MTEYTITELPLVLKTPHKWAEVVIANPIELLNDHAHLEKKALIMLSQPFSYTMHSFI